MENNRKYFLSYRTKELLSFPIASKPAGDKQSTTLLYEWMNYFFSFVTSCTSDGKGNLSFDEGKAFYYEPVTIGLTYNEKTDYISVWQKLLQNHDGQSLFFVISNSYELGQWQSLETICALHQGVNVYWINTKALIKCMDEYYNKNGNTPLKTEDEQSFAIRLCHYGKKISD